MNEIPRERAEDLESLGVLAFTTTRDAGDFGLGGVAPVGETLHRWMWLQASCDLPRLACAHQVHGAEIVTHRADWSGWLRHPAADGHVTVARGTGLAVSIADCVPVFLCHPRGFLGMVHAGWRGTVAQILPRALDQARREGFLDGDLRVRLGPAICGRCYEVSPDVYQQLTGRSVARPTPVDLRDVLAAQAKGAGVTRISQSEACTRCHNERFFSHRAGDAGRQIAMIAWPV